MSNEGKFRETRFREKVRDASVDINDARAGAKQHERLDVSDIACRRGFVERAPRQHVRDGPSVRYCRIARSTVLRTPSWR